MFYPADFTFVCPTEWQDLAFPTLPVVILAAGGYTQVRYVQWRFSELFGFPALPRMTEREDRFWLFSFSTSGARPTTTPFKQIVIAAGERSKAALSAFDHLIRMTAPVA